MYTSLCGRLTGILRRVLVIVLVVSLCVCTLILSVFAVESDKEYVSEDTFWHWLFQNTSGVVSAIVGYSAGSVCTVNADGYHCSSEISDLVWDFYSGDYRLQCICESCGAEFFAYQRDVKQSYESQVSKLPAPGFNSDGSLLWSPKLDYFDLQWTSKGGTTYVSGCPHYVKDVDDQVLRVTTTFNCELQTVTARLMSGTTGFSLGYVDFHFSGERPIDGYYQQIVSPKSVGYYTNLSGQAPFDNVYTADKRNTYYDAGTVFVKGYYSDVYQDDISTFYAQVYNPVFKVIPLSSIDTTIDGAYGVNSRPSVIAGSNYGIIGDDGQLVRVSDNTIINETTNIFYNPVTGNSTPVADWSYNYVDRSYTVKTESGDTITITYGDENITIREGDIIYNVYYVMDGSGPDIPGPDVPVTCDHAWTETSRVESTCTAPGSRSLTCSKCGQTKAETLPAAGHTWTVKQSVTTQYGEDGGLIQQGYTIYECSVCGEQYKDDQGVGPPSRPSDSEDGESIWSKLGALVGTAISGILDLLGSAVDVVLGGLIDLVTSLFASLQQLVGLFGSVGEAFSVLWTWLPPEITAIFVAGVSIFVFVALLKLFMK